MKKQIEQVAQLPIKQQNWSGLMGAKDSVRFPIKKLIIISCLSLS
jgi:hypothetical protein